MENTAPNDNWRLAGNGTSQQLFISSCEDQPNGHRDLPDLSFGPVGSPDGLAYRQDRGSESGERQMKWGSFPSGWLTAQLLPRLEARAGLTGTHLCALKLYLAISLAADFRSRKLEITNDDLTIATNLSRPMLKRSFDALTALGILAIHPGRPFTYELLDPTGGSIFAKVPYGRASLTLRKLPNRGESVLAALKIYLILLRFRETSSSDASIGHEKLQQYTGVRPNLIRSGLDHLVNHALIHIHVDESWSRIGRQVHRYKLLGYNDPATPESGSRQPLNNPFAVYQPPVPGASPSVSAPGGADALGPAWLDSRTWGTKRRDESPF